MMKKIFLIFLIFALSFFTIRPLFSPGFFPMHDDVQVARVIEMSRALANGQFPVRIVGDLGYGLGYPLFNFYGPLPYYLGGVIHTLGIDSVTATKIMIGMSIVFGNLFMLALSFSLFGVYGGLFSTVLFGFLPYRAVQLYVRGAIGESWALSLLPALLLGLFLILQKKKRTAGILIASMSLSGVILSHTVFGYIATGSVAALSIILFLISLPKNSYNFRSFVVPLIIVLLIALGLTAFFWLPALSEMPYTNVEKVIGSTADYKDHYVCLSQLWDSPWGFGGSAPGCIDGMSFKLGKLHIIAFLVSLGIWFFSKKKEKRMNIIMLGIVMISGFLLFFVLPISQAVWNRIPLSPFIQYPWRFLGPIGLSMSLVSGYLFYKRGLWASMLLIIFGGAAVVWINAKLFIPQYMYDRPPESFEDRVELRWRASKVSDEYLPKDIVIPTETSLVMGERVSGNEFTKVHKIEESESKGTYEIEADRSQELKLRMAFFPGWRYLVNGKEAWPKVVEGEPYVVLSSGISLLEMRFSDTLVRKIGNGISLITVLGIVVICTYGKKTISNHRYTRL